MHSLDLARFNSGKNVIVALKNGQIRIYNGGTLVHSLNSDPEPTGMLFGTFGREEGCLVVNHKSGSIIARIL
jgi:ABC-type taurine transport system substrate-binding protein